MPDAPGQHDSCGGQKRCWRRREGQLRGLGGWNQVDCVCFGHRRAAAACRTVAVWDRLHCGGLRALNPRMFDRAKPSGVGWTSLKRLQLSLRHRQGSCLSGSTD